MHQAQLPTPGERVVVSFGPEHAALEQKQVERAIEDAQTLVPKPKFVVFCAFTFDPEAAKDIDETQLAGRHLAQGPDEHRFADRGPEKGPDIQPESFWLMGQPEVELTQAGDNWQVEVTLASTISIPAHRRHL
ncbi:hypothetical protein PE067_20305 [Paracoccus sp. DMF-8]|uniref:hypothetical protein n=1 Tax=Paracoccus sp. DMF-8 TaxID=3019445 RepID=UPI0023E37569|nr:hypothetical protein [Paracoccus sp. DMF-8]MDF3608279.1 hypothetical protein [Paracoccus sp. DMF-8]